MDTIESSKLGFIYHWVTLHLGWLIGLPVPSKIDLKRISYKRRNLYSKVWITSFVSKHFTMPLYKACASLV